MPLCLRLPECATLWAWARPTQSHATSGPSSTQSPTSWTSSKPGPRGRTTCASSWNQPRRRPSAAGSTSGTSKPRCTIKTPCSSSAAGPSPGSRLSAASCASRCPPSASARFWTCGRASKTASTCGSGTATKIGTAGRKRLRPCSSSGTRAAFWTVMVSTLVSASASASSAPRPRCSTPTGWRSRWAIGSIPSKMATLTPCAPSTAAARLSSRASMTKAGFRNTSRTCSRQSMRTACSSRSAMRFGSVACLPVTACERPR